MILLYDVRCVLWDLLVAYWLVDGVCCLFVVLCGVCRVLVVVFVFVRCSLFVLGCLLYVAYYVGVVLFVACCSLFVDCWLSYRGRRVLTVVY